MYDDDDYDDDDDDDVLDYWLDQCGWWPSSHTCTKAGTEECDIECPFARLRRRAKQKKEEAGK